MQQKYLQWCHCLLAILVLVRVISPSSSPLSLENRMSTNLFALPVEDVVLDLSKKKDRECVETRDFYHYAVFVPFVRQVTTWLVRGKCHNFSECGKKTISPITTFHTRHNIYVPPPNNHSPQTPARTTVSFVRLHPPRPNSPSVDVPR